ncbi:MAG: GNAT family N-acetyltransferase [Sphingobium sp.]|nr:GNAT family N-acetyltransferase [Sphingobium sp.]
MAVIEMTVARAEDVPALKLLVESAYRGDSARAGWTHEADLLHDERVDEADLLALMNRPDERILLFRQGDVLVGCAQVTRKNADYAYFGMFAVAPPCQNSGLGKHILAAAEHQARTVFGVRLMEMTVIAQRTELIAYYERRGYCATGERRPFPVELDLPLFFIVLEKSLA